MPTTLSDITSQFPTNNYNDRFALIKFLCDIHINDLFT